MGEILIFDKGQADTLLSLGFKYNKRIVDGKEAYVFVQTPQIMKELNSKFEKGSFLIDKTVNF